VKLIACRFLFLKRTKERLSGKRASSRISWLQKVAPGVGVQFLIVWTYSPHFAPMLSVIRSTTHLQVTGKIVTFLQDNFILRNLILKCIMLEDCSIFTDDADIRSPMGVSVGSFSQTDFKSA